MTSIGALAAAQEGMEPEPSLRRVVVIGLAAIIACFGGLGGWSMLTHLDSAALAPGVVVVDSHRKTVQHLEGGILRKLLVQEGDLVHEGQPLALLDTTQSEAQLGQLISQQRTVRVRIARLRAEQQDRRTFEVPASFADQMGEPAVAETIDAQRRLFEARWRAYDSAGGVVRKRIQQFREQIAGATAQLAATEKRLALFAEDLRGATYLFEQGYEKRSRVRELQRNVEELNGQASELRGVIAQAQQSIAGAEMEIANLGDTRQAEIAKDLEDDRGQDADLADRIRASRDVLDRRQILSPQDGYVTDIRLVTPGGVIAPAQPLMDIVPADDPLIVEARVNPHDIDVVHPGQSAQVQLSAFRRATTPPVDGVVTYVSADMITDQRNGESYFIARIAAVPAALSRWARLSPGMPADVMIVTGERRAFEYFIEPLQDSLRHAFRED